MSMPAEILRHELTLQELLAGFVGQGDIDLTLKAVLAVPARRKMPQERDTGHRVSSQRLDFRVAAAASRL